MKIQKTFAPSEQKIHRDWHFIDANAQVLGRLAVKISNILAGKNKAEFTPNALINDKVVVTNADKIRVTGKKAKAKTYNWHTGYPKGLRSVVYEKKFEKDPRKILRLAIRGMLPKNKLQDKRMKSLFVYVGSEHPHKAQVKSA